ncbi:bifunctional cobalt-precorrin-7 (C(5))-methyltransferase/cobalt-precorrin-6B (C(15))-methyltransferase [Desulfotalea psychrophila]|uniref:Probable precorrin-6Y C5,15-methyltransferase (CobL) n=1 Tax=Desulfotalea psychrophila (strain LSv54 / DSM 12343) TaxID=177439 RepID=Q6ARS5_DESPS|nr:bifunctional cobalt-precorrin-7 (C(5))-methyltransferase/cobalt-precorrin-6B (C(15))-methyltransferase [Desulfotalea psychrophila]CAG34950.1 probable precorrin-6Y C5,15-methyltransferase (CobL) [Desulfotalea psychrophila LSv54]
MNKIHVIGVGADLAELQNLAPTLKNIQLFVASPKHHPLLAGYGVKCRAITPLDECLEEIRATEGEVAVLASGDPLFYGIGASLLRHFGEEDLLFYPGLSSIQRACALFKIPWHDAQLISLHGREANHIPGMILPHRKSLILTDGRNSPNSIAREILNYLLLIEDKELTKRIELRVGENLGTEEEWLFTGSLQEAAETSFAPLNVLCVLIAEQKKLPSLGLIEEEICHSRGLITKNEVRAASLHRLQLPTSGVLWDIGAGSGSVSIEAARLSPGLTIYSVEHKEEEIANIKANIRKFATYNVIPILGRAAALMEKLPLPDRIFVGGSGGELGKIIETAKERLPVEGRIVINAVLKKTALEAMFYLRALDLTCSSSKVSVSRIETDGNINDFNPITIIAGQKIS